MDSWWDFCGTFWKGPGWCPGGGRLGDASQVAEVPVRAKHEVVLYCTVLYCTVLYCTVLCYRIVSHSIDEIIIPNKTLKNTNENIGL